MESKVLGIPLAVILFVIGIALLVNVPALLMHREEMRAIGESHVTVAPVKVVVTPVVASPSATPTVFIPANTKLVPATRVTAAPVR